MSFDSLSKRRLADAPAGWQPIGLPTPEVPPALARRTVTLSRPNVARLVAVPSVAVAASAAMVSMAAASPAVQVTTTSSTSSTSSPGSTTATGVVPSMNGTVVMASGTAPAGTTSAPTGAGLSAVPSLFGGLPLSKLPTSNLPVAGGFLNGAVLNGSMFTGGLFGGQTVQTSVDPHQSGGTMGDTAEGNSTDICDFFLQHMWKNADGIPLLGSSSHFLTYHTDPSFQNLVLSLASGAIGNSSMPIIDVYEGPLGWIPIFNPKHMRAHGADYLSLITGCGGMGLPIDTKTLKLDLSKLPSPDKLSSLATKIMPTLPSLSKILGPDYLYNTLDINQIMNRLGPSSAFNTNEYVAFAGKNFDVWRLLWQQALAYSTNPTKLLQSVAGITNNVQTLQSLGLPGLPGSSGNTLTSSLPLGSLPFLSFLSGPSGSATPGSTDTSASTASPFAGLPVLGSLLNASSPFTSLPVVGSVLSDPTATTPTGTTSGTGTTPTGSNPTGSNPSGDSSNPLGSLTATLGSLLPVGNLTGSVTGSNPTGSNPTGSNPTGGTTGTSPTGSNPTGSNPAGSLTATLGSLTGSLPVVGSLTGGLNTSTPAQGSNPTGDTTGTPSGTGTTPTGTTPTGTTPTGGTSTSPTGSNPTGSNPAGSLTATLGSLTGSLPVVGSLTGGLNTSTPAQGSTPPSQPAQPSQPSQPSQPAPQQLTFQVGAPQVDGRSAADAPGVQATPGQQVTISVPVTNTGTAPITSLQAQIPGAGGSLQTVNCGSGIAAGASGTCSLKVNAPSGATSYTVNIVATSADGQQMTKLCRVYFAGQQMAFQITGNPSVTAGAVQVPAGSTTTLSTTQTTVTYTIRNTGQTVINSVKADNGSQLGCGFGSLAPGQSGSCSVTFNPAAGSNTLSVPMTLTDAYGTAGHATFTFTYTAQ